MADVRTARRRFSVILIVLLVIDLAAVGVLLSPIGRGSRSGDQQVRELQQRLNAKTREVVPLRGIDQKIVDAQEQMDTFYKKRLPANYSSMTEELGKVAAANGVAMSTGKYQTHDADIPGVAQVLLDAGISGPYANIVKFINAIERDEMFFLIDGVALAQAQGGAVRLQMKLETYVRE